MTALSRYLPVFYVLLATFVASSCQTTKNPPPPEIAKNPKPGKSVTFNQGEWWERFGDRDLSRIVATAMKQNLDIANMVARSRIAEQSIKSAKAGQLPYFSAAASGEIGEKRSGDVGISTEQYGFGFQASWEIDVWGKLSSQTAAQLSELQASQAQLQAGRLNIAANLTRAYIRLRLFDEQQELHRQSLKRNQEILEIYMTRHKAGRGTEEEVRYQEAEVLRLEGEAEELSRQRALEESLIAELLGEAPGGRKFAAKPMREVLSVADLPKSLDAQAYERRPDLIAAESKIRKAYYLEESARAARLPKITLGASASALKIPASPTAWVAMLLPQISFPALDPQTKINQNVKEIELEIARNEYKQVVNLGVRESVDALRNYQSHARQLATAEARLERLQEAHKATNLRFQKGRVARLEVLDSERQLIGAEQGVLSQYAALLQDNVAIFTAIGGDW